MARSAHLSNGPPIAPTLALARHVTPTDTPQSNTPWLDCKNQPQKGSKKTKKLAATPDKCVEIGKRIKSKNASIFLMAVLLSAPVNERAAFCQGCTAGHPKNTTLELLLTENAPNIPAFHPTDDLTLILIHPPANSNIELQHNSKTFFPNRDGVIPNRA